MVPISFLDGVRIYLRPLEKTDLDQNYCSWLNDSKTCEGNSHAIFPYPQSKLLNYYDRVAAQSESNVILAIVEKTKHLHIGNISLQNINWISRNAEFAVLLGNKDWWGKGIGEEAGHLICDYGFKKLNLHRIYCGTFSNNVGMQKLAAKLKMEKEGHRRQAFFKNGEYLDVLEYGVLKSEFYRTSAK